MKRFLLLLAICLLLGTGTAQAQLIGLGPFTAEWDYDPTSLATFVFYVDNVQVGTAPVGVHALSFTLPTFGQHVVGVSAKLNNLESGKANLNATNNAPSPPPPPPPPVITDPSCTAPLGNHAPAIFPTSRSITTGRPGSRSLQNFQLGGPDPVVEIGIQIDGVEQMPTTQGADLRAAGSVWFTQPPIGTHNVKVRVLTNFGCQLIRDAGSLVVKP